MNLGILVSEPPLLTIRHIAFLTHLKDTLSWWSTLSTTEKTCPRGCSVFMASNPEPPKGTLLCGLSSSFSAASLPFSIGLYLGHPVWSSFWGSSLGSASWLSLPWIQNIADTLTMALTVSPRLPSPHSLLFHQKPLLSSWELNSSEWRYERHRKWYLTPRHQLGFPQDTWQGLSKESGVLLQGLLATSTPVVPVPRSLLHPLMTLSCFWLLMYLFQANGG